MPSIPQSLLWISLVVLWLFVLVPMLVSKRDAVRRTSDVALATRVLNSAHGRPADQARRAGGRPSQRPRLAARGRRIRRRPGRRRRRRDRRRRAVARRDGCRRLSVEEPAPDYLDVRRGRPGLGTRCRLSASAEVRRRDRGRRRTPRSTSPSSTTTRAKRSSDDADQYEYIDDTSGIPIAEEPSRTRRSGASTGGIALTRTRPPRSVPANTPSASGC